MVSGGRCVNLHILGGWSSSFGVGNTLSDRCRKGVVGRGLLSSGKDWGVGPAGRCRSHDVRVWDGKAKACVHLVGLVVEGCSLQRPSKGTLFGSEVMPATTVGADNARGAGRAVAVRVVGFATTAEHAGLGNVDRRVND